MQQQQQQQDVPAGLARALMPDTLTSVAYPPLKVAAFNIQIFGRKKMRDTDVTHILVKILSRYDLVLIQEIRDSSETALDRLVNQLNQVDPENPFEAVVSEKLGRTNCKEQYAFLYRTSRLTIADTFQYDDGEDNGLDTFQREPFAVRVNCPTAECSDFGIIAIHTDPDDAVKEIGALHKVYESTKKHWGGLADIMIAGDFNADEGYVDQDEWSKIALRNDRRFNWLIDDEVDTTVKGTDRAYDRFVVAGKLLVSSVVPGSTGTFRFDTELGLTAEEAEDVSDHYPIEMEIKGKMNRELQSKHSSGVAFVVTRNAEDGARETFGNVCKLLGGEKHAPFGLFTSEERYTKSGDVTEVVLTRKGVADVVDALKNLQCDVPEVMTSETIQMAEAYMESNTFTSRPYVYGLLMTSDPTLFDIMVRITDRCPCTLYVQRQMSGQDS